MRGESRGWEGARAVLNYSCPEGECELKKGFSEENNANNKYNHNFDGRFCICDEIYNPDLETRTMHQCVVCEDWFHEGCIPHEPTDGVQEGIICRGCLDEAPRLRRYAGNDGFRVELQRAEGGCLVEDLSESEPCEVLFVPENWRQSLCNCEEVFAISARSNRRSINSV